MPWQSYSTVQYLWNLTMLQEILGVPHIDGVFWSLTVELVFYFGMAALFVLGWLNRLHLFCLGWALACVTNYVLAAFGIDVFWRIQKYALLRQGHFLIAGIMFYELWHGRRRFPSYAILALCLTSIFLAYSITEALTCAVFFAAFWLAIHRRLRFIVIRPLLWLGSISYALYVSHQLLGFPLMQALEAVGVPRAGAILAAIAMALGLADTLTRVVDRPARAAIRAAQLRRADIR
jgi:peptidoglycan/LPS O-acetylase OafA/YrhL